MTQDNQNAQSAPPDGSSVLEAWISFMEEKIGREISRSRGDGLPVPYFCISSSSGDGVMQFVIDDHKIQCGHTWIDNDDLCEPIQVSSINEGENVFIGYKSDTGIALMIEPASIRYMEESDQERPHPMTLLLDHVAKEYFEGWQPDQIDIRLMAIFSRMRNNSATSLRDELEHARRRLTDYLRNAHPLQERLAEAQRRVIAAENMDPQRFRQECQGWEELLLNQGSLSIDRDNHLILRIPEYTMNDGSDWNEGAGVDVSIGPLAVSFHLSNYTIKVRSENRDNCAHGGGHPHPHVSNGGDICWGNSTHIIERCLRNPNPMEVLFTVAHFLKEGYHEPGAYTTLQNWLPPTGWMCHHCNVRHQDNTRCPHQCARCEQHVNWDTHAHCDEHNACYTRPSMCTQCLESLPKITDLAFDADMPNVIQPPKYIRPTQNDERAAHHEWVGIGPNPLIPNQDGGFVDFVKDGNWHWIQSPNEEDQLLKNGNYIYKKQENGSYQLHWTNPNPVSLDDPEQNEQEDQGAESGLEEDMQALLSHYHQDDMTAQQLVDALHTDRIPSYDDVPEQHRPTLRQFRRRNTTQRLRLATRYVNSLEDQELESTGS